MQYLELQFSIFFSLTAVLFRHTGNASIHKHDISIFEKLYSLKSVHFVTTQRSLFLKVLIIALTDTQDDSYLTVTQNMLEIICYVSLLNWKLLLGILWFIPRNTQHTFTLNTHREGGLRGNLIMTDSYLYQSGCIRSVSVSLCIWGFAWLDFFLFCFCLSTFSWSSALCPH